MSIWNFWKRLLTNEEEHKKLQEAVGLLGGSLGLKEEEVWDYPEPDVRDYEGLLRAVKRCRKKAEQLRLDARMAAELAEECEAYQEELQKLREEKEAAIGQIRAKGACGKAAAAEEAASGEISAKEVCGKAAAAEEAAPGEISAKEACGRSAAAAEAAPGQISTKEVYGKAAAADIVGEGSAAQIGPEKSGSDSSRAAADSLISALIRYRDNLDIFRENAMEDGEEAIVRVLENMKKETRRILTENGVEVLNAAGVPFSAEIHLAEEIEETAEPELNDMVAFTCRDGYRKDGVLLRQQRVAVYKLSC